MVKRSSIEWTETTWNPVTGCTKKSAGCLNCYAHRMALRLKEMGMDKYKNGFEVTLHPDILKEPYHWRKGRLVFMCSMGDLFHEDVPLSFIQDLFNVMNDNPMHIFQILTKRSERLVAISSSLKWSDNIWMGVTVESMDYIYRMSDLKKIPAKVKFISAEPLLSPLHDLPLEGIDWVIVGGESGPGARIMKTEWVRDIRDQCQKVNVAFFFKQWGGFNRKKTGRMLDGKLWEEYPEAISAYYLKHSVNLKLPL